MKLLLIFIICVGWYQYITSHPIPMNQNDMEALGRSQMMKRMYRQMYAERSQNSIVYRNDSPKSLWDEDGSVAESFKDVAGSLDLGQHSSMDTLNSISLTPQTRSVSSKQPSSVNVRHSYSYRWTPYFTDSVKMKPWYLEGNPLPKRVNNIWRPFLPLIVVVISIMLSVRVNKKNYVPIGILSYLIIYIALGFTDVLVERYNCGASMNPYLCDLPMVLEFVLAGFVYWLMPERLHYSLSQPTVDESGVDDRK